MKSVGCFCLSMYGLKRINEVEEKGREKFDIDMLLGLDLNQSSICLDIG